MLRVFLFFAQFCLLTCLYVDSVYADSGLTLVYVSHMANIAVPQAQNGYAELETLVNDLRAQGENVVLFHGGNILGPSAMSSYDKGAHMIGILNALQPDVLGLGRRDFLHKEDELDLRIHEAIFPVVCSNIYDPISLGAPGEAYVSYILPAPNALGFLSLVSTEMQNSYLQKRLVTIGGYELLPDLAAELQSNGAEYIVATADFLPDNIETVLSGASVNLLILSGTKESGFIEYGNKVIGKHSGNGDDVLLIRLQRDTNNKLFVFSHEVLHLRDYSPNLDMLTLIDRYAGIFSALIQTPVGQVLSPLDTRTRVLRTSENAMGNLISDALRDYYQADVALVNSGAIRGNCQYEAGILLTRGDLQSELPLHDVSCLVDASGATILAALEHGVGKIESASGRFLQVSGLRYTYDAKAPLGSRVVEVEIGGKPLEFDAIYSLSLPEYLNSHGDNYSMFSGECKSSIRRPQQELVEIVRAYLSVHSPVSPMVEGRIRVVE